MPKVTVQIDTSLCITAANCVGIAPQLFQIGDEAYVELLDGGGAVQGGDQSAQASPQGSSTVKDSVNGMKTSVKDTGKQRASDAKDKAMTKGNDSLQNLMNKIPH